MRASDIADRLATVADTVASMLLPNGKRQGAEWCAGSVQGEAGDSLKVRMTGGKAGVWCDFASGESGDLLDLWAAARAIPLADAIAQAKDYLGVKEHRVENPKKTYSKPSKEGVSRLLPQHAQWLLEVRKITGATCDKFKLASRNGNLMFPYLRDGELIAAKYRPIPKKEFFVDGDCEPSLFGWQALPPNARTVVLCEGEMDALAFAEYGVAALSVPFGGGKAGKQTPWIEAEFDRLAKFDWIYLALDSDGEGQAATLEIMTRLGRERCRLVTLPFKDANECLMKGVSRESIQTALAEAQTQDPDSLRKASAFEDELVREFANVDAEPGIRLPWPKIGDRLILRESEVSIWAGVNGHGKSQVIGQVVLGALADDWLACVASMEFRPAKWLKRIVRQATAQAHPAEAYVRHIARWFHDKLWAFDVTGKAKSATLLEVFAYAARRYGVKLFVIDNLAKCGFDEDDYNGQKDFVDQLTDFAKLHQVHVALVCHMRKTESEDRPSDKMGVKGSGAITDMADTFVAVWRNKAKEEAVRVAKAKGAEVSDEIADKPDALLICGKQRNGEEEPKVALWFDQRTLQYLEHSSARPRAFVEFSIRGVA
jgi:twinkle protein